MKQLIVKLKLQLLILQLQLQVLLLKKKLTIPNKPDPHTLIVHHGGGPFNFREVNNYHKNLWGFRSSLNYYIGYQLFIEYSGKVYRGRSDNEEGAHTRYHNIGTVGVCLQGNMETGYPTQNQLLTLEKIIREYKSKGLKIKMHKDFNFTICPGKHLSDWLESNELL